MPQSAGMHGERQPRQRQDGASLPRAAQMIEPPEELSAALGGTEALATIEVNH